MRTICALALALALSGCAAWAPSDDAAATGLRLNGYTAITIGEWTVCAPGYGRSFTARAPTGAVVYGFVCNLNGGFASDLSLRISVHSVE